ncbi:hypothetical protein O181_094833 [Austropuccinia psidii MF-1]|uniref:Uncharacterized protein n=1 Tax=Austropuccinia psidii MF-1 TaxID=1389203 RepID=A0A9Q3J3W8_9BASI|nr:hypothetical protein [Austropuccinia psidii MF-1]
MLEKGWNPQLPEDKLRKSLIDIHPIASSFIIKKQKWDKSHKVLDFKVGDLVLVSTFNFNNIKGQKKLKDYHVGAFVIIASHRTNAVQVKLRGELGNKNPTFPLSLIKPHQPADKELFT